MNETPPDDFNSKYIRLRTVLDGFEHKVLRYCLEPQEEADRLKRLGELEPILTAYYNELPVPTAEPTPEGCPEGYVNCGGICLPYPCPGGKW